MAVRFKRKHAARKGFYLSDLERMVTGKVLRVPLYRRKPKR